MHAQIISLLVVMLGSTSNQNAPDPSNSLNGCCDYFSYGFCLDLPLGADVLREDSGMDFVIHSVSDLGFTGIASFRVYEGHAPQSVGSELQFSSPENASRVSLVNRLESVGTMNDELNESFVFRTGLEWPRFVHVWYEAETIEARDFARNLVENLSVDRSEALLWAPDCEARQHEFPIDQFDRWISQIMD